MAKKKNAEQARFKFKLPSFNLNIKPETKYGVIAVISFALALFFMASAFGKAGVAGRFFYDVFSYLLGWGYFLLPITFIILGSSFARAKRDEEGNMPKGLGGKHAATSLLFLLSALGLMDIFRAESGGALGAIVAKPFMKLFDVYVAVLFLSAILIISLLLTFERWPNILGWVKKLVERWFKKLPPPTPSSFEEKGQSISSLDEEESSALAEGGGNEEIDEDETEEIKKPKKEKRQKDDEEELFEVAPASAKATAGKYVPPPLSLLEKDSGKPGTGDVKANMNIIKRTLQNFGIEVEMDEVTIGPTVTRYALKPAEGMKLSRILGLQNDIALALAAHPIRIEAPIPGKSLVGIEVPNRAKSTVGLATLLSDSKFAGSDKPLTVALGKNIAGRPSFSNLAKMPHAMIAGTTGSGKSVTIHAIITSLLYRNSPEHMRFILIDPKRVELTLYNGIPHLLTPVITDPKKAILSLKWATKEMERRYNILEQAKVRDISSYHEKTRKNPPHEEGFEVMPYIVIIIDELADIMTTYPRELESAIVRLAQMSRAVGIHLILSTQRPSVNVITGLIKANIPARIALQVSSQIDSRTILDSAGAEKLLGAGDMLFLSGEMAQPERLQSAFISEAEVKSVVKFITKNNSNLADELMGSEIELSGPLPSGGGKTIFDMDLENDTGDDDELYEDARLAVIEAGKASTSYLQRKLKVGYSRAARLIDMLEERGVIGAGDGAKPREVLERPVDNIDDAQL